MKSIITTLFAALTLCVAAAEIDINGKFVKGMDGWFTVAKGAVTEIKTKENDRCKLQLQNDGKDKKRVLVYSRMYSAGSTGDVITLDVTASGTGTGFVGIICYEPGGSQANILYQYFYAKPELKKYSFKVTLPESCLKDKKGNIRKISKIRISFGILPGANITFTEVNASPVPKGKQ